MKFVEDFWYPVLDARTVSKRGKTYPIKRFGIALVLWRDTNGSLVCMEDKCAHKGVQLSLGRIHNNCIQCPYHGLRYAASGACVAIPPEGPAAKIPSSLRVKTFYVREAHNFVWLWWGQGEPTKEIPWYDELQNESDKNLTLSVVYPSSFYRLMESNFDGYHIDYLHARKSPQIGSIIHSFRFDTQGYEITTHTELKKRESGTPSRLLNKIIFPALSLSYAPAANVKNIIFCCPIDSETSWFMVRFYLPLFKLPFIGKLLNWIMMIYTRWFLLPDDFKVQRTQQPREVGMGFDKLVVSADRGITEYWRLLRQELDKTPRTRTASLTPQTSLIQLSNCALIESLQ